jgi:hypothetical protein
MGCIRVALSLMLALTAAETALRVRTFDAQAQKFVTMADGLSDGRLVGNYQASHFSSGRSIKGRKQGDVVKLATRRVILVASGQLDASAKYGLEMLRQSLNAKGLAVETAGAGEKAQGHFFIVAGVRSDTQEAGLLRAIKTPLPQGPQALVIRRTMYQGKPALILCGSDALGLMYAALDVADRVSWAAGSQNPFSEVRDTSEGAYLLERGVSMYTMQRAYFESRLYDENHWQRYFDLLAHSRINAFTVIFGYENGGFMAPLYPYFFDVNAYPGVRLIGITREQQERNVQAFRLLVRIAHERGIAVTAAIWDHIYRGGVQGGGIEGASESAGKEVPGLVAGLTAETLAPYTKAALRRFLEVFPELDGLEFRMHTESGLKQSEMAGFWHEVFGFLRQSKPRLRLTLRAKDLPDEIIEDAVNQGLNPRIETKYWMEQMGLPFHPTHINRQNQKDRRHGYADLLRYPQQYRVHWRLWTGGTARLLLWADPDYVRRFSASARLYDGNSLEVNEMLATKMLGEPHDKAPLPILNPTHRYYDYEFERYWHFYQVWGRLSYNPETPPEVWEREFGRRFGAAGPSLMQGLHLASRVLPRIVASSYRYQLFPTTRGWAEMMRQDDLPKFAELEGSDIEQFMNPREAAKSTISGAETSLRRPEETSLWFSNVSENILKRVREAEAAGASGNEALSTITDLKILASLAKYYAQRLLAAVSYNIYRQAGDLAAFDLALELEQSAADAWEEIVKAADDVYAKDLAFGVERVGFPRHWKDELGKLRQGIEQLRAQRRELPVGSAAPLRPPLRQTEVMQALRVQLEPVGKAHPGLDLPVTARVEDAFGAKSMRLRYRHLTQFEDYQTAEMTLDRKAGRYVAHIPGGFITPKWDLMYFVEAIDQHGKGRNYPDLESAAPFIIVTVERRTLGKNTKRRNR